MSKLAERLWRVSERKPIQPDVIVPLSYAMLPNALAFGTTQGIHAAYGWATQFPSAVVAFGNPSHCFPGSEIAEEREKMQLLQTLGLPEERIISGGPIQNTVTELRAVAAALKQRGIQPLEVLLVIESLHSRGGLYIAQRVFPGARISLKYSHATVWQPDHPFFFQQSRRNWFMANILRQVALRILGIDQAAKVKHRPR